MEYLKVEWVHDFNDEPSIIYSELDHNRNEWCKIEIYKNGQPGTRTVMPNIWVQGYRLDRCQHYRKSRPTPSFCPVLSRVQSSNRHGWKLLQRTNLMRVTSRILPQSRLSPAHGLPGGAGLTVGTVSFAHDASSTVRTTKKTKHSILFTACLRQEIKLEFHGILSL